MAGANKVMHASKRSTGVVSVTSKKTSNNLLVIACAVLLSALALSSSLFNNASAAPAPVKTTTHRRPHTTTTKRARVPVFAPLPIPAPRNIAVYADDRAAVLSYDSHTNMSLNYRIVWGPADGSAPNNTAYWPYEKFQVQPLTPGVRYFAIVQSIGTGTKNFGNFSLPAGPVYFSSDSSRVDSIRAQATGFFDDFNTSPGDFDQGKWDTSYGKCAEPLYSATFINGQFHAHNAVRNVGDCNTTSVDARPRTMFDFTGRTGKVFFDFDGPQGGNYWFLNFNRAPYFSQDSQMREALGYQAPPSGSVNEFFIHLRQDRAQFHPFGDSRNFTVDLCKLDLSLCKVINVRRRFVAEISKTTFKLTVNGKLAMSVSGLSLPFEKATLSFKQRGSRQQRADSDFVTVHWDNFGFDGPAAPVLTRNFRAPAFLDASWKKLSTLSPANTVSIPYMGPVPVGKVLGARFMYRMTPSNGSLAWSKMDYIQLNGAVNLPIFNQSLWKPTRDFTKTYPDSNGRGGPTYHFVVQLTADQASKLVLGGTNTFKFVIVNDGIITQAHLEVDYQKTGDAGDTLEQRPQTFYTLSAPSYHPVSSMKVGPIAKISQLGNLSTEIPCLYPNGIETGLCYDAPPTYPGYPKLLLSPGPTFTQSGGLNGVYDLRYRVRPSNSVSSFGKSIPIANVTVYIDNKAVYTQVFPKTIVQYYGSWKLDTKTLSKGAHTVSIQALDVDGTPSWQDYAQYSTKGVVYPVYFTVA